MYSSTTIHVWQPRYLSCSDLETNTRKSSKFGEWSGVKDEEVEEAEHWKDNCYTT